MNAKERMLATLEFRNKNGGIPMDMWTLPWAQINYPTEYSKLTAKYPSDIVRPYTEYAEHSDISQGDSTEPGLFIDAWGCRFTNIQRGVIGEIKNPIVPAEDEDWEDTSAVHIPYEELSFDIEQVNAACRDIADRFILPPCCPRPFEQLQFIRGTENLYVDIATENEGMLAFLKKMHAFYCEQLEKWAETDMDALMFMDDWGSERSLLINPKAWKKIFLPLYRDYINIAHSHGKKIFMHSDGNTLEMYPDLIEAGLDAINSQIFCIGIDKLAQFRGRITFWGELDRQWILPKGTEADVRKAIDSVYNSLWADGGCIAQCEFGPGCKPSNVDAMYDEWLKLLPRQ